MIFRFGPMLRKYEVPYELIRKPDGSWDDDGVYQRPEDQRIRRRGVIQPIGQKLLQLEGGRYSMDDRVLYTTVPHDDGDVIEYQGKQYTVNGDDDREQYCDTYKYTLRRVTTHDPVP